MKSKPGNIKPPRLGRWLLERFCSYDFLPTALWDLQELFEQNVVKKGLNRARMLYLREALSIIFHLFLKGKSQYSLNKTAMFKHAMLIAFRNFKRHKSASLINLFGLSLGLASALMIYLWVHDELKMDQFNEKDSDRHYQIMLNSDFTSGMETRMSTPGPLTDALVEDFPEVAYGIRIMSEPYYAGVLSMDEQHLRVIPEFADQSYFDVFRCDFVAGSKEGALSDPSNIVISEAMANNLFENVGAAIGQTVQFKNEYFTGDYMVTGVFKPHANASMDYDVLISYDRFLIGRPELKQWDNGGTQAHLVLNEGVDPEQFNAKIRDYLKEKGSDSELFAQKFSDKYLYGKYVNGVPVAGRMVYVRVFSSIALFVLIIACINYMNLSTAQASRRVKEIGVKKAIGAHRKALVYQYFAESVFMCFLSLLLAIGLVLLLLPQFNQITGKQLSLELSLGMGLTTLAITLLTGLVSGIYPGLFLSGFKPVSALKGQTGNSLGGLWIRKGLVVFQFAISLVLITTVIITYRQTTFVQNTHLGYDREHVISFVREGALLEDADAFIEEAKNLAGVVHMSSMWGIVPLEISGGYYFQWKDQEPEEKQINFSFIEGHYGMAELLDVELIAGRFLSPDFATDDKAVVLNETAAKLIGYENPVGGKFYARKMCEIVGVVKDFHFAGLHEKIEPFFFILDTTGDHFVAKIEGVNQAETIKRLQELHATFNPGYPFDFKFLDDDYQQLYEQEARIATLSKYFAGIAIAISCLGLLALTAFSTQRRFKEIAIRKVLGSTGIGIIRLLSKEFIWLVLISIVIALPIGYYLMKNWLEGFAYRISLDPMYFITAGIVILIVAWCTIITQTARSARMKVVDSLRVDA